MKQLICLLTAVSAFGIIAVSLDVHAQEKIRVLSDGPLRPALVPIADAFRRDSGHDVEYAFGTSPAIRKRVAAGQVADVLIIQPNYITELVKSGKLVPGEHPIIGRVGFGLAARTDAPVNDIGTVEALRQVLLNADSLIFNSVASGNYFASVLDRLNISEAVKGKVVRSPPPAVFDWVRARKGNDIGVGTIPQILVEPGLRLIGPLPPELQGHLVYAAAPMSNAPSPSVAKAFIAFLASPVAKAVFAASSVESGNPK